MQNIQLSNGTFDRVIRKQKSAGEADYRLLIYCLSCEVPEGVLLLNVLSREMILLEGHERYEILDNNYLREHWFVVPQDFDDKKFAVQVRQMLKLMSPKPDAFSSFTILTTTDCNARCFYCYELGHSRIPMTHETAHRVADYIYDNYAKLSLRTKQPRIRVSWFGGEPLYNSSVIDIISNDLKEKGVNYYSSMISNGYLFDTEMIAKAVSLWNLKKIQITLDGTEKTYNRTKNFIYDGNAFERVMNNIGMLLDANIKVNERMNIDVHNADNLLELTDLLSNRFHDKEGLFCYPHALYEVAGEAARLRSSERRRVVYDKLLLLQNKIEEKHLNSIPRLSGNIKVNHCMADSGHSVVITPGGNIGLCEHYLDSDFFSHINTPDVQDSAMIGSFRETLPDLPLCDDCAYYPLCIRLKKCEENSYCFPEIREDYIRKVMKAMLARYENWKRTRTNGESDEEEEIGIENC